MHMWIFNSLGSFSGNVKRNGSLLNGIVFHFNQIFFASPQQMGALPMSVQFTKMWVFLKKGLSTPYDTFV